MCMCMCVCDCLSASIFRACVCGKNIWQVRVSFVSVCNDDRIYHTKYYILCSMFETVIIFTNPSARAGYDTRSIFKRGLAGFYSEFSFSYTSCLTKAEEPSLPYYFPIAGGRIIGFIPFPRVLVLCEMQSVRSRIWTGVAVSISCDNNHYTMGSNDHAGDKVTVTKRCQLHDFTILIYIYHICWYH